MTNAHRPTQTYSDDLLHSLRNIAAALEGGLRVLDESRGDEQLNHLARRAMSRQIEHLKEVTQYAGQNGNRSHCDH